MEIAVLVAIWLGGVVIAAVLFARFGDVRPQDQEEIAIYCLAWPLLLVLATLFFLGCGAVIAVEWLIEKFSPPAE